MSTENDTNRAVLHWDPAIGFELDVDVEDGEVSVRMVRVPVPADGTAALGEPVTLYALDTLFKSQVDVQGAPGQLDAVQVQVLGASLRLRADVEDAETGEVIQLDVELPLERDGEAPAAGGPVPKAPVEDELDWEDEETLERMFDRAPETVPRRRVEDELDEDDDSEERPGGKGLAALLKALMDPALAEGKSPPGPIDSVPPGFEPPPPPEPRRQTAPQVPAGLMSAHDEARAFLELLVSRDELELSEDGTIDDLLAGAAQILERELRPSRKASQLTAWLLDQDAVEELYIDDESLEELLEKW